MLKRLAVFIVALFLPFFASFAQKGDISGKVIMKPSSMFCEKTTMNNRNENLLGLSSQIIDKSERIERVFIEF